jgi:hypothetical protein
VTNKDEWDELDEAILAREKAEFGETLESDNQVLKVKDHTMLMPMMSIATGIFLAIVFFVIFSA